MKKCTIALFISTKPGMNNTFPINFLIPASIGYIYGQFFRPFSDRIIKMTQRTISLLLLGVTVLLQALVFAQFQNFGMKDGLVFDNVVNVSEDDEGLIYIASKEGLNIFNGEKFLLYNQYTDPHFSNKIILSKPLKKGFVLISTEDKGIFLHDKYLDSLIQLNIPELSQEQYSQVNQIFCDEKLIYLGCGDGRILTISLEQIHRNTYKAPKVVCNLIAKLPFSIEAIVGYQNQIWVGGESNWIYTIESTKNTYLVEKSFKLSNSKNSYCFAVHGGNLIIGTQNGMYKIDINRSNNLSANDNSLKNWTLDSRIVRTISVQPNGSIWAGTEGGGLFKLSGAGEILDHYFYSSLQRNSIHSNYVLSSFINRHNQLVTGTWYGGIDVLDLSENRHQFIYDQKDENDIYSNIIWCSETADDGKIYLGTHGNGIAAYTPGDYHFRSLGHANSHSSILTLYFDRPSNCLFIGTWGHGIKVYNLSTNRYDERYQNVFQKLGDDRIYSIVRDTEGFFWIGTFKNGLYRMSPEMKELVAVPLGENFQHKKADVRVIYPDKQGLWIGSLQEGLFFIKKGEGIAPDRVTHLTKFTNSEERLSVENMYRDKTGRLWLLCRNGLGYLDGALKPIQTPVLKGTVLTGMRQDEAGHFWVSSYTGIYRINETLTDVSSFLTDHIFYDLIEGKSMGSLFASSNKGLLSLQAGMLISEKKEAAIYFANLQVLGQTITPGEKFDGQIILPQKINYTKTLQLPYAANSFTLEINTLSLLKDTKNHLQYRLNGYDKIWNTTNGTSSNITFTNVPPGNYVLEVRISDENNSIQPQLRSLRIQIAKPWWTTTMAIMLYFIVAGLLIWWLQGVLRQRIKMKKQLLEQRLQQENEQALYRQKMDFFTNVSHDLRTPLTLILGPVQDMLHNLQTQNREKLSIKLSQVHRNAKMLLALVNQILDFRKAESDQIELNLKQILLHDFVKSVHSQFSGMAQLNEINFLVKLPDPHVVVVADPLKLESIFFNLLSNAFKFTPKNGTIEMEAGIEENRVRIVIRDTGIGIAPEEIHVIFTRFYQVKNNPFLQGTGIGMALIKKYVELHGGVINVTSIPDQGSTFTITLPVEQNPQNYDVYQPLLTKPATPQTNDVQTNPLPKTLPALLVVEDNFELKDYLTQILEDQYIVFTATGGEEGIKVANQRHIDLIISDLKMEGMSGTEFCKRVRGNINTSHIPFVLLTANSSPESQLEAFETGADAYIEKPFNSKLLLTRVEKLIEHREKLKVRLLKQDPFLKEIAVTKVDEDFMEKLNAEIYRYLDDADYRTQHLASTMHMGQDQLYRKVKVLTGISLNQYIRHVRLTEAKKLMATNQFTISEIVFKVGFNNASYFTRAFKKEFGVLPKEYSQIANSREE